MNPERTLTSEPVVNVFSTMTMGVSSIEEILAETGDIVTLHPYLELTPTQTHDSIFNANNLPATLASLWF